MISQLAPSQFSTWRAEVCASPEASVVVLDVREPWEVQTASVREDGFKLVLIPMSEVPARLSELKPDQAIACLCHHGMRSMQVANYLLQNGFTQVVNLQGGIDAWAHQVDPSVPRY